MPGTLLAAMRGTDARAIDDDAARGGAGSHQFGHLERHVGIVGGLLFVARPRRATASPRLSSSGLRASFSRKPPWSAPMAMVFSGGASARELVFGQFDDAHAARRPPPPRRGCDNGPDRDAQLAAGGHVLSGDHLSHESEAAVQFVRTIVMKQHRVAAGLFLVGGVLWAHPMGNFSVSHYSRIEVERRAAWRSGTCWIWRRSPPSNFCSSGSWTPASPREELERKAADAGARVEPRLEDRDRRPRGDAAVRAREHGDG